VGGHGKKSEMNRNKAKNSDGGGPNRFKKLSGKNRPPAEEKNKTQKCRLGGNVTNILVEKVKTAEPEMTSRGWGK